MMVSSDLPSAATPRNAAVTPALHISAAPTRYPMKTRERLPVSSSAPNNQGAATPPMAVPIA